MVGFFALATPCMNMALAFPKHGLHIRALWVLLPGALLALLVRR